MKISQNGIDFIKGWESLHDGDLTKIGLQPKLCPAGVWTVGYGHAIRDVKTGKFLKGLENYELACKMFNDLTEHQANDLLKIDLMYYEDKVNKRINVEINQNQFDALVSHTYNTGGSNTLFGLVNANAHKADIYNWFTLHYITANRKVLRGLILRRKAEAELYFKI